MAWATLLLALLTYFSGSLAHGLKKESEGASQRPCCLSTWSWSGFPPWPGPRSFSLCSHTAQVCLPRTW
ncbi:hypothetical protein Y1Q_0005437 [Alligator mississippiensis]|uniref:Uncharacterized protein n=1 Tax=Alligator mississippiensis TaxID=8496 RepID=A0A151PJU0_ALLMI|nr:hypothetical protein Y1Q_0005437 [Alligator mississippiensis]